MNQNLFGDVAEICLTKFPTIVEPILSYLNAKDLSAAACVCSFWNASAKRIWQKRKFIVANLYHKEVGEEDELSMQEMGDILCKSINGSVIFPCAALMYLSRCDEFFSKRHSKHIRKVAQTVKSALPNNCKFTGGLGGGVIGRIGSKSLEVEQREGLSVLLLPRNSGVFINDFFFTMSAVHGASKDEWRKMLGNPKDHKVKLVLLNACCEVNGVEKILKMITKTFGKDVLIAGGLVESIIHGSKIHNRGVSGLVFAGNMAASLVINKGRKSNEGMREEDKEQFIQSLQGLKESLGAETYDVIFMYSCVARGYSLYREDNVETTWISEVFPGVPVVGMFAFGEIGYGPDLAEGSKTGHHAYSTVLCLCKF
eukprot:gene15763-7061_t